MAIRITQIKPEGAQKSAPSAKDYSGEKKGSAGGAVSGGSGRIKITKLPEAEAPHTVAAGRKTTRETERADELDKLTRPSARRIEAADEADKQNPPRRTLETPAGSSLVRDMDGGALQQEMVRQPEEAAKNGLFQRALPEERGSRHHSGKELSQKILRDTETAERIRSAAAGTAQGAAANTAGFLGALVAAAEKIDKQYRDEKERLGVTTHADEMNPYPRTNEEITRGNRAGVQLLEGIADTQRAKAQESTARAKKGASALGSAGVDALQIGLNLAAIVGASAAAPGAGLLLMGTQSGGAAANDYRQYAAANGQEANPYAAAGLAIGGVASAGIGSAAAKGALKYGGALVNRLGLGNSRIAQYALGALSDAAFSGGMSAANEYAKAAAYGDSYENVRTKGEDLAKDMLFQAAVGFLCRTLTSSFGRSTAAGQPERVQREYFKDIDNLDDLARAFKQYGRQYHPDRFATADAATQRQMSDIFARISAEYNAVKAELAIETAGRAAKSYGEKRGAKTPEAASAAGRTVENELLVLKRAVENGTLTGTDAAEAVQIMEAVQNTTPAQPAAAQESAQGAHEGNLTPAPETGAEGALQAQKSSPAQDAGYSRQRAGGPVAPSGVSATQESKVTIAPAAAESKGEMLSDGRRGDLGRYADERNAQEISRGLNDGTLAVDANNRLYRVNEDEHIDRRSSVTVGRRSVNAFQFDHPELHQYFRDAAADLAEELSYAEKGGEIVHRTSHEAGDDEYFRTKRVASERIARLLDDERIGYDDIDRAVTALIHDEGQENFAAAKRVELMLDNMLTSGYTDIHGRYVAPNESYIAAKRAIRGADAGAQVREELPLWDMPEAQNGGGVYEKQQTQSTAGTEPAEAGGRRANAVGSDGDLYGGNGERRTSEPGAGGTEKLRKDAERRDQELKRSRQRAAMMQPLTSAAALDVNGGTERALVHVLPEESWDDELHSVANFAHRNGVQRVTMVTGALEVDTGSGIVPVNGCINYRSGEMVLRVDSVHHTATEIARHEIGHLVTEERNVRAFMQEVRRGDAWHELYDAYEKKYAALTRNYIGMTPEDRALYVWEEILEDAYAEMDNYGQQASAYHDAAVRAVDGADAESTPARGGSERPQMRAVDEPKSRGPPERFSVEETDDGRAVAVVDDDILSGIDTQTWDKTKKAQAKAAAKAALLTFKDGIQVNGIDYKVSKRSRDEFTRSNETEKLYRKNKDAFADKMRAAANADDIITAATDWAKDGGLTHPRTGNLVDFAHGDVLIQSGDNQYDAKVVVGITGGGEYVFYDVVDMEPTSFAKKEETPTAASSGEALSAIHGVSLNDSISDRGENVKSPTAGDAQSEAKAGEITGGAVPSAVTGGARSTSRNFSNERIADASENVKPLTFWEEVRRQIMGEDEKANAEPNTVGAFTNNSQSSGGSAPAINSAHDGSIADNSKNVKPKTRFSVEDETDSTGRELTVQQQEYFRDSKVRDEQGRLLTMYHGTNADKLFTVFDTYGGKFGLFGRGSYFTDNPEVARSYTAKGRGNSPRTYEVYLNIKNPLDMDAAFDKSVWKDQPRDIRNAIARAATNEDAFRALKQYCEDEEMIRWEAEEFISDTIRSAGFDGITHIGGGRYGRKDGPRHRVFIAFDPEQIKNVSNETPTDAPDIRFSAEDEDGGELDKELARMPQSVQETVQRAAGRDNAGFRKEDFPNLDAYLSARDDRRSAEKAERLRDRSKDEFEGTEALEKLGVKIENSAGDYSNVRQLIENDKAAKQIQKETRKAIQRLGMTPKEQSFALNIASGLYVPSDIPRGMDRDKVLELADYYAAEHAMSNDLIRARRSEINDRLQEKMEDLFDEKFEGEFTGRTQKKGIAPESGFALYHRTPQRSMRAIFGWDRGQKINEAIFEPVYVNEQERKRFVNRMHDEVRTFKGEDGKEDALTQRERALAQLSIEGKAVEEMVGKSEIKQQIIHAAENLLDGAEMKDAAQEFGLHGKEERELAQRYADWLETKRELDSGEVDRVKVENAAAKYSGLYNEFYAAINDFLVAHGYEPIGFIKGYAPHFQPEAESGKLERALKAIGVDLGAEVGKLPASIAGLTKEFKPNKRYNPFFQHRNGTTTDYDIQKGFEKYVDYLSDVLYHTDDIMRTRAASKYFRKKYAPDDISAQLEQVEQLRFATPEEKELFLKTNGIIDSGAKMSYQAMNQAMEKYTDSLFDDVTQTTKYGDLVTWLDDYANKLAGKQLFNDRSMEREVGRMSLNVGRKLVSTFARANVAGNLSSALNQTAQLPMIAGELGPKYVAAAIGDIARGEVKGDFAARSDFLTEKHGIDYLTNTKGDKFTTALFWPLERMDYLVSSIAVRGKYRKELAEGKSEKDALRAADRWGRDMMGSRSKGTAPLTFQSKNLVSQMVNLFQVEALNSWEHVTQDLFGPGLREMEEKLGKKEASRRLAGIIVGTLLGAFILNRVDDELYGGTPAQFDVLGLLTGFLASGNGLSTNEQLGVWVDDVWQKMTGERLFGTDEDAGNDEFNLAAATEDTLYNVSNDVPYVRNVSGLLGLGDQTLPMPDIYGTFKGIGGTLSKQASGDFDSTGDFWAEVGRQLMGLVGDTVPGGRQVEKSVQGAEVIRNGGLYKGSGENKRLQYPAKPFLEDPWEALRAALFGRNALGEARDFYASNDGGLSASQTRTYQELIDMGADREVVYDAIQKWRKIDKDDRLTDGEREAAQYELVRKLKLTNEQKERLHDELSRSSRSYAAVQEAQKQGISAEAYAKYKDATADLTADKDENGKTINGSKKAKVLDAIDRMQLNKKQKDWMYLDAGYSEKDIGKAPWH